jgi:type II secretory ATPase GspE/PulE/Tfp pilus assembly ATPase PilB-like protein
MMDDGVIIEEAEPLPLAGSSRRQGAPVSLFSGNNVLAGSATTIVDRILTAAIEGGASDIHIEPLERAMRVRLRLDGKLWTAAHVPAERRDAVISHLKVLGGMDIAERRRPQDGRLRRSLRGRSVDVRISTLPGVWGEKAVLRILDQSEVALQLDGLGLLSCQLEEVRRSIHLPYGMILVTGPTGSGKTTTLYAALSEINRDDTNIITIEDPIEYRIAGITQAQAHVEIGFSFAAALRSFLRQDPDVIMVGEIRDGETASIAVRAAMTGHLVLSTLHTNDAASAFTRLMDLGVEPFLIAASLRLVLAQRLVRCVCPECAGRGCESCRGLGLRGRTAVFEALPWTEDIAPILTSGTVRDIRSLGRERGWPSLRDAADIKVREGVTTRDEASREIGWLA